MSKFYTFVTQYGDYVYVRGYRDGMPVKGKTPYNPTIYASHGMHGQQPSAKTLDGTPVFERKCKGVDAFYRSIDEKPDNVEFYGTKQLRYAYIYEEYPGEIKWDKDQIKLFSLDIETATESGFPNIDTANEEILLITIKDNNHKQLVTFTTRPFTSHRDDLRVIHDSEESMMLKMFVDFWEKNCPDVVTGWNVEGFDIPYLVNRIKRMCGESWVKRMSPFGIVKPKSIRVNADKTVNSYNFMGITVLDYLALYKKFTYTNQESYRLDHIANVELGENKLENPEDNFKDFYTKHWDLFVKYNIHDVELVDRLEDKMKLIELAFTMAYSAKINFEDVYSPVRMWDVIIYNYLRERGIVVPMDREDADKFEAFEGAYVKDPLVGQHKWVASFDLNSLYPHLIMQYNMSPETLTEIRQDVDVERLLNGEFKNQEYIKGLALTANGWCYRTDVRGFLPTLMEEMYTNRTKYKKLQLAAEQEYEKTKDKSLQNEISRCKNMQMAMKIALNSAYGAIGNRYFRYYDLRIAEGITTSGQLSIRWMANRLNDFMNKSLKTTGKDYVIAIDTDSIYLTLERLVETVCPEKSTEDKIKFMDKVCEEVIQPVIDKGYQELANYMNAYEQKMQMKREVLADKGIWVAKKRYVLNVHNSEGVQYAEPKIKVMGLEMVKSSTPAVVRQKLKDALKVILYKQESDLQDFVKKFKAEFSSLPVEEIAFPRSVSDLDDYNPVAIRKNKPADMLQKLKNGHPIYASATPMHVRGALLYNHYVQKNGLDKKYQMIGNGDKIKFVYLFKRNPMNENVISFLTELPKELDLHKYIDYDLQFEKTFTDAIDIVIRPLGWNSEKQASLDLMFA